MERQAFVYRYKVFYPFLKELAGLDENNANSRVLVMLAFDDQNSAIVSFGLMDTIIAKASFLKTTEEYNFSGSLEYEEDFDAFEHFDTGVPVAKRSAYPAFGKVKKGSYQINWSLDAVSLSNSMDFSSPSAFISAKLPDRFRIMIFYDIENLPFENGNFAMPSSVMHGFWPFSNSHEVSPKKTGLLKRNSIALAFNGEENKAVYDICQIEDVDITESFDPPEYYCRVKVLRCQKRIE